MKLLEYESKRLLTKHGIPTPNGVVIERDETNAVPLPAVIKSQVPVGGRGKAGGVQVVHTKNELQPVVDGMSTLGIKGHIPTRLLAEELLVIDRELYLSLLINRASAHIELMAHIRGGVEVEENPADSFFTTVLTTQTTNNVGQALADYYDAPNITFSLQDMLENLLSCMRSNDATLIEINPLVITADGKLIAGDCKMELDDAASFRHDWRFEHQAANTNFVTLDETGTVATIANGAGLAMATVDAVTAAGMRPANFLDIGGGADSQTILAAFKRIMQYTNIKAIIINIFAGITRCDDVARAIIDARAYISNLPPLYIRLAGTNYTAAAALLERHDITLLPTLEACLDAAREVA